MNNTNFNESPKLDHFMRHRSKYKTIYYIVFALVCLILSAGGLLLFQNALRDSESNSDADNNVTLADTNSSSGSLSVSKGINSYIKTPNLPSPGSTGVEKEDFDTYIFKIISEGSLEGLSFEYGTGEYYGYDYDTFIELINSGYSHMTRTYSSSWNGSDWIVSSKGSTLSSDEVLSRINGLRGQFPNGMYWDHDGVTSTPCNHIENGLHYCNMYEGVSNTGYWEYEYEEEVGTQCAGFASLLSDLVFGADCPVSFYYDFDSIRVGDQIRLEDITHTMFVIEKGDDYIKICDCNSDYVNCQISWDVIWTREEVEGYYFWGISRYDEEYIPESSPSAPDETPEVPAVPESAPSEQPNVSPNVTPNVTPDVTPEKTPDISPDVTPEMLPEILPDVSLVESLEITPDLSSDNQICRDFQSSVHLARKTINDII